MKKLCFICLLLFLVCQGVSAEFAKITFCDLDVQIDIETSRYDVCATVDFIANESSSFIFLHMENEISQITANGEEISWYTIGSRLIVNPSKASQLKDDLHRIEIRYYGYAKDDPLNYSIITPEFISLRPAIFWLPVYPDLVQINLNYRMTIALPKNFIPVSDGIIEKEWLEDDLKHYQIIGSGKEPILIAAPFYTAEEMLTGQTLRYFYLETQKENAAIIQHIVKSAKEALQYYQKFALQFPNILNILLFPNESANAEPNMIIFPETFNIHTHESVIDLSIYHEIFHLIIPTYVGAEKPWLSEGLAHYMGFKALGNKYGFYSEDFRDAVDQLLQVHHEWHNGAWLVPLNDPRYSEKVFNEYAPYLVHDRSALSLFTLDYALGDKVMTDFWKHFLNKYWNQKINANTLINELTQFATEDLSWFFEDWINGVVRPDYLFKSVDYLQKDQSYTTTVVIENVGTGRAVVPIIAFGEQGDVLASAKISLINMNYGETKLITTKPIAYIEIDPAKLLIQTNMDNDVYIIDK